MGIKNKGKQPWLGKRHTEESKKKMSNSHREAIPWNKGKTGVYSEETRKKISEAKKGKSLSNETKAKIGVKSTIANLKNSDKISARFKGLLYWNNGIVNKRARECPGEGWTRGRL